MKKDDVKKSLSNEKGITLVSLLITVLVMVIIVGVSIDIGLDSVYETRLQGFYTQLEIIQKRVDDITTTNEGYYITNDDGTQTYVDIKTQGGSTITSSQTTFLQDILSAEGITTPASEFRYFTVANLEEQLDLSEIEHNVFIHFDTRTVIAENGITINGEKYYMLKNNMYYAEQNISKNEDTEGKLELTYSIIKYGSSNYKITVTPSTIGDLTTNGTLKYKKTTTKYWETANGLEIVISDLAQYNIEYVDSNNNKVSETITVALDDDGNPTVTVSE